MKKCRTCKRIIKDEFKFCYDCYNSIKQLRRDHSFYRDIGHLGVYNFPQPIVAKEFMSKMGITWS